MANWLIIGLCLGAFCLCAFCVLYLLYWYFTKPKNAPPGPTVWPIIGSFPTVIYSAVFKREVRHKLMTRLSRIYGKIFAIHLGTKTVLYVLSDAKAIREAFQRQEFSKIPFTVLNIFSNDEDEIDRIFNGENWTQHRQFTLSFFQNARAGSSSFDSKIADEMVIFSNVIENGEPFNPIESLKYVSFNILCSIVMSRRFDYDDQEVHVLLELLARRPDIASTLYSLRNLPLPFVGKMLSRKYNREHKDNLNHVHSFIRRIVEDHKQNMEEKNDCKDLIDFYLDEIKEKKDQNGGNFQENYLENLIDMYFIAGTEGVSNTLAWCFLHMVADPDIQQRIRGEITATCGADRLPTYSDRSKMPYTEAFLMEVQRQHTMIPLGFPHIATKTTTLEGYAIPEGTVILASLWAVHHDPKVWNEPEEFKPTRFLDKDGNIIKNTNLIPLSAGRRSCAGERIAKMAMFISLTHLVRHFRFTSVAEPSTLTFNGIPGFKYSPHEFYVSPQKIK